MAQGEGDISPDQSQADRRGNGKRPSNPRKELVREQLLDIAAGLFERKGFEQTSMNDIAQAMGLGRSAVYHYFRNKEEILAVMVESEGLTPSKELEEIRSNPGLTPVEKLRLAITTGIERRLSGGSRFNLISRLEPQIPEELQPVYNKSRRHIFDLYVELIREGVESGAFRAVNPKLAAFAVIGMANWTSRWYAASGPLSPAEIGEELADFAIHALLFPDRAGVDEQGVRNVAEAMREQLGLLERLLP